MSEFIADLRESRIPTVCDDFDSDDFLAELRPQRSSSNADHSMEMDMSSCHENIGSSDEHLHGLLTSSQFSTDQIIELIQGSTETLIKKLLYGRRIAHLEGQIRVTLEDEPHSPIVVNFNQQTSVRSPKSKSCSPMTHVGDEFNIRLRRRGNDSVISPKHHHENTRQSPDFTPLKFVDEPYLKNTRRGSDDSGYGGKNFDMDTSRLVPSEERFCPSTETVCTMLEPELRYVREPSCENIRAGQTSPASETWEELDDEGSPLIIDESYDTETQPETTSTSEQDRPMEQAGSQQVEAIKFGPESPLTNQNHDHNQHDDHGASSVRRSSSLPVDLSGDSEDPRGSLSPNVQNLVLCSSSSPQGLVCRLCHATVKNMKDLSRHAAQTHNLFTCVQCSLSFPTEPHLKDHVCHLQKQSSPNSTHSPKYLEAQVQDYCSSHQPVEQVLDLSMRKRPEIRKEDEVSDLKSTVIVGTTRALSSRPGQNVSRDGYGQPGPDSSLSTSERSSDAHFNQTLRQMQRMQSFDTMGNGLVSIKVEPGCRSLPLPAQNVFLVKGQDVQAIPIKTEEPSDRSRVEDVSPRLMTSKYVSAPRVKPPIRFSPYSREKLTELTARFLASRKVTPTAKEPPTLESATADEEVNKASYQRELPTISAQVTANVNDEISCEVSKSETALKNRVNAFVKNGGHQGQAEAFGNSKMANSSGTNSTAKHTDEKKVSSVSHGVLRNATNGMYTCGHESCGEEFVCFQALEHHSVDSHGRYLCEHCGKTFTARPNRDRHVRYHTGERPYKCDLCPMAFFRGDDLKYHRTTRHPTAEPFVCKRCNRNFTWNRDLERHQRHCRCKA